MENENKITGKEIWEIFKIQNKFFKELHLLLDDLDEIDFDKFDIFKNKKVLNVSGKWDDNELWVPDRLQFSYKKNKERIGINIIFRNVDLEEVNLIDEPLIVYSFYKLEKEGASDEWDNIFIISTLNEKNKFTIDSKIPLSNLKFQNDDNKSEVSISKGYLKATRLFDLKTEKHIKLLADEIKSWIKELS